MPALSGAGAFYLSPLRFFTHLKQLFGFGRSTPHDFEGTIEGENI
ncbi:MAG TPA: hypothetical protein VFL77_11420 [Solirubrobacterales bacterium]|nr:hypothetical protein [Solirubrobacterales bacterium]